MHHDAAARPARGRRPQPRPRRHRRRAVRDRHRSRFPRRPRPGADPTASTGGPPTAELRRARRGAARPAAAPRASSLAGERERAGWWGAGRAGRLGRRRRGWSASVGRRARRRGRGRRRPSRTPWHPGRCAELLRRRASSSATPASCTRGSARPTALPGPHRGRRDRPRPPDRRGAGRADRRRAFSTLPGGQGGRRARRRRRRAGRRAWRPRCARAPASCCESVRLFDVYTGAQVGAGTKSLAFALRFRAPDRTLTEAETGAARDAAVALAAERHGAVQR